MHCRLSAWALLTADDAANALNTGWAEFLAFGKAVLINPNFATLIKESRELEIQTEIDLAREDRYGYSDFLWNLQLLGLDFLPPVKGIKRELETDGCGLIGREPVGKWTRKYLSK